MTERAWHPTVEDARDIRVPCCYCGKMVRYNEAWIDACGEPFKAYYHEQCKRMQEFDDACNEKRDVWLPACHGTEEPSPDGRWLYVFNPASSKHGWLNLHTDIVQEDSPFAPTISNRR